MQAYLDYNSTTPLDPEVLKEITPFLSGFYGNASSFHQMGQASRHAIETAREHIADTLETEPGDLIFTSGGTEEDNLAVRGTMEWLGEKRKHLIVSAIEHQAVLHPAKYLEAHGFKVDYAPVSAKGMVDIGFIRDRVTDQTALVSVMHVNNEIGTIQPLKEIADIAHKHGAYFHADAVQSYGKLPIVPGEEGIDLLTLSAHKICGPKGAGALFIRKGLKVKPIVYGGHQEKNIRPGTENVAALVGFGAAARLAVSKREEESARVRGLRDRLRSGIEKAVKGIRLNGDPEKMIYNTLNLSFEGLEGETLLMNLDLKNIYASTGSACTAGSIEPSHVLLALGLPEDLARAAIRFSLGRFTTESEVDYAIKEMPEIVERLRKASVNKK